MKNKKNKKNSDEKQLIPGPNSKTEKHAKWVYKNVKPETPTLFSAGKHLGLFLLCMFLNTLALFYFYDYGKEGASEIPGIQDNDWMIEGISWTGLSTNVALDTMFGMILFNAALQIRFNIIDPAFWMKKNVCANFTKIIAFFTGIWPASANSASMPYQIGLSKTLVNATAIGGAVTNAYTTSRNIDLFIDLATNAFNKADDNQLIAINKLKFVANHFNQLSDDQKHKLYDDFFSTKTAKEMCEIINNNVTLIQNYTHDFDNELTDKSGYIKQLANPKSIAKLTAKVLFSSVCVMGIILSMYDFGKAIPEDLLDMLWFNPGIIFSTTWIAYSSTIINGLFNFITSLDFIDIASTIAKKSTWNDLWHFSPYLTIPSALMVPVGTVLSAVGGIDMYAVALVSILLGTDIKKHVFTTLETLQLASSAAGGFVFSGIGIYLTIQDVWKLYCFYKHGHLLTKESSQLQSHFNSGKSNQQEIEYVTNEFKNSVSKLAGELAQRPKAVSSYLFNLPDDDDSTNQLVVNHQ